MSGTALPTAGRFRFVASDRTSRPWITLFVLRGVHVTGSGSGNDENNRHREATPLVIARPQAVAIHAPGLPGLPRRYAPRNDEVRTQ